MLTSLVSSNLPLTNPQQRGSYLIIRQSITCPFDTSWVYSTMSVQNFTGQNMYFHSRSKRIKYIYNTTKIVSRIFVFMFRKQFIYEYTDPKIFKDLYNYIVAHLRCVYTSFWNESSSCGTFLKPAAICIKRTERKLTLMLIVNNYKSWIDWLVISTNISNITTISCKRSNVIYIYVYIYKINTEYYMSKSVSHAVSTREPYVTLRATCPKGDIYGGFIRHVMQILTCNVHYIICIQIVIFVSFGPILIFIYIHNNSKILKNLL